MNIRIILHLIKITENIIHLFSINNRIFNSNLTPLTILITKNRCTLWLLLKIKTYYLKIKFHNKNFANIKGIFSIYIYLKDFVKLYWRDDDELRTTNP